MMLRRLAGFGAVAGVCLLSGCHHRVTARTVVPPPPAAAAAGPVMVSVPPPTHRSTDISGETEASSSIPVVKPVRPPKKTPKRIRSTAPQVAVNSAPAVPPAVSTPPPPSPARSLGQLTASTDDSTVTRDAAASALRREQERIAAIPAAVQAAHGAEIEQARRFVKSASESWNASDYAATVALSTKAHVLLDDLLK